MKSILIVGLFISTVPLSAQDQPEFPYQRNNKDWFLFFGGVATTLTAGYLYQNRDFELTIDEISKLNRKSVNGFDRGATYNFSQSAYNFSDIPYGAMPIIAIAPGIPILFNKANSKKWDQLFTLGLMYVEVKFLTRGITSCSKTLAERKRPYLYNTNLTLEERFAYQKSGPDPLSSFFSGHTSVTFAFAVLLSKTYTDIYGKNTWSKVIWISSLSLAAATAWARVEAGVHYPTDVIAGALVGSAIGYFVPELHKRKNQKVSLSAFPGSFILTARI